MLFIIYDLTGVCEEGAVTGERGLVAIMNKRLRDTGVSGYQQPGLIPPCPGLTGWQARYQVPACLIRTSSGGTLSRNKD